MHSGVPGYCERIRRPWRCVIESTRTESCDWRPYTVYVIRVQWTETEGWTVARRFSEFDALRRAVLRDFPGLTDRMPAIGEKSWFRNLDPSFIKARLAMMRKFLAVMLKDYKLFCTVHVRNFLSFKLFRPIWKTTPPSREKQEASESSGGGEKLKIRSAYMSKDIGVDDFRPLALVGQGSYAQVYQVQKRDTKQIYAMKILNKRDLVSRNQVTHTRTERKILESIDHPFIVSLRFAFQTTDHLYMVFDFFSGGEMFFHLRHGRFSQERAKFYTAEILLALECLHKNGVIYRDLKPENILLDGDGHIKLTDFGLSKLNLDTEALSHTFCGTPHYLAPEVIRGNGYGMEVDWWSLGTLLYELLTGLPPFYDKNTNKMYQKILTANVRYPPHFPADTRNLISGLLERDPKTRLGSHSADEIKNHAYFKGVSWDRLSNKQVKPPYQPSNRSAEDLTNVDNQFKLKPLDDLVVSPLVCPATMDSPSMFPGFTYQDGEPRGLLLDECVGKDHLRDAHRLPLPQREEGKEPQERQLSLSLTPPTRSPRISGAGALALLKQSSPSKQQGPSTAQINITLENKER